MNKSFFQSRLFTNILLVILVITTGLAAFFFWFDSGLNYVWDSEAFNNIVTPVAAILSVILFSGLTYRQIRITQSHNKKVYLNEKFNSIKNQFYDNKNFPDLSLFSFESEHPIDRMREVMSYLNRHSEFQEDQQKAIRNEAKRKVSWFLDQSYYDAVRYLESFTYEPLSGYEYVVNFVWEVKDAKLLPEDESELMASIREEFVSKYINLIDQFHFDQTYFLIPFTNAAKFPDGEVRYENVINNEHFKQYYQFFKEELYS